MNNRTRTISSLALAGALAVASAGAAVAQDDEQVTLQYWAWFPPLPTTEKMIEAFEAENPNIDVEINIFESQVYQDKLPLALASGDALDLVAVQTSSMVDQLRGDLQPLEPLLEEHVGADWAEMYAAKAVDQAKLLAEDGELYILPLGGLGSVVGYVNAELMDELGLEVPTNYDELKAYADAVTAADPNLFPVVFSGANWFTDEILLTLIGQTDPEFYNDIRYGEGRWDDPAWIEGVTTYKQMHDDGIFSLDTLDIDYSTALEIFYGGGAPILLQGTWEAGMLSEPYRTENGIELNEVGLMPLPVVAEGGTPSIRSFIEMGLAVPNNSDNPEEAMKLLEFLAFGNGVDVWAPTLSFVPAKLGYALPETTLTSEVAQEGFATLSELIQNPSSDRNNTPFSQIVGDHIIEVLNGADPADVAAKLQAEWESGRYLD